MGVNQAVSNSDDEAGAVSSRKVVNMHELGHKTTLTPFQGFAVLVGR